ncbi:MAG: bifunctional nuclease family protein [Bacteroidales bacterium]|nr:bifunctional nuclease family protein [Bacteroidales bacterium]
MRRVRLDIGAVAASPEEGGSFTFFLYREGMDRCLPVPLTPPQMHSILSNFKQLPGSSISMQSLFAEVLQQYRIELLEVSIVRSEDESAQENNGFVSELLFFDGDKEIKQVAGFVDGIILSKSFSCPIYISEELLERHAKGIDVQSKDLLDKESLLNRLKEELQEAINNEEYERASEISKRIESIKNNRDK